MSQRIVHRAISRSEVERAQSLLAYSFNWIEGRRDPSSLAETFLRDWDLEQTMATFVDDMMVAYVQWRSSAVRVDGTVVPLAVAGPGATLPEYRGSHLLSASMAKVVACMRETGHWLSAIQSPVPGWHVRNGWGIASGALKYRFHPPDLDVRLPSVEGHFERVGPDGWRRLDSIYRIHAADRNLAIDRVERDWNEALLGGAYGKRLPREAVVWARPAGQSEGYLIYDLVEQPVAGGSETVTEVFELVALSSAAYTSLLRYLAVHNNVIRVEWSAPPDDPLLHLVRDPSRIDTRWSYDKLLRVVDVGRALELIGSRLATRPPANRISVEVVDELHPWSSATWLVHRDDRDVEVERAAGPADIRVQARALGPLLSGFTSIEMATLAGGAEVLNDGAMEAARRLSRTRRPPFCADAL